MPGRSYILDVYGRPQLGLDAACCHADSVARGATVDAGPLRREQDAAATASRRPEPLAELVTLLRRPWTVGSATLLFGAAFRQSPALGRPAKSVFRGWLLQR